MPAHSKELTHRTSLRYTSEEDTTISETVRAYAEVGITLSRNDAVRVLIRRASVPLPESEPIARRRWADHVRKTSCACSMERAACADGWWLMDMWGALVAAEEARTASAPPPPAPTPEKTVRRRTVTSPRTPVPPLTDPAWKA